MAVPAAAIGAKLGGLIGIFVGLCAGAAATSVLGWYWLSSIVEDMALRREAKPAGAT
jgi:hypothetical protein